MLLDFSAMVSTINNRILLERLWRVCNSWNTVLLWPPPFSIINSNQCWKGEKSSPQTLTCSVPQGSKFSPLLFNNYLMSLGEIIHWIGVWYHLCTIHAQLYISTSVVQVMMSKFWFSALRLCGSRWGDTDSHSILSSCGYLDFLVLGIFHL